MQFCYYVTIGYIMNALTKIIYSMNSFAEALEKARKTLGSYAEIGRVCGGLSANAVRKWVERGHLPRTEWTKETEYAKLISEATKGAVPAEKLLLNDALTAGDYPGQERRRSRQDRRSGPDRRTGPERRSNRDRREG